VHDDTGSGIGSKHSLQSGVQAKWTMVHRYIDISSSQDDRRAMLEQVAQERGAYW